MESLNVESVSRTQGKAIILIILCTLFTSAGQILWKMGLANSDIHHILTFLNLPFLLGFGSYGIGLLLMLLAFKHGELSVLFPIIATSYVWVSFASPYFFSTDSMNIWKWVGVILIVMSVSILGIANSRGRNNG